VPAAPGLHSGGEEICPRRSPQEEEEEEEETVKSEGDQVIRKERK
jgi:hypothetical protein